MKKIILIGVGIFLLVGVGFGWWYFQKYDNDNYEHIGFFPTTKLKPIWERKIKTNQELSLVLLRILMFIPNELTDKIKGRMPPGI
jgi:hypothetical protein